LFLIFNFFKNKGALFAIFSHTTMTNPNTQVGIIFIPIPFPILYGLIGLVCFDIVGLLRGWKGLGHAAHLTGVSFGILYYFYLQNLYQSHFTPIFRNF
jgi:rhomboid-like protein